MFETASISLTEEIKEVAREIIKPPNHVTGREHTLITG